MTKTDKTPEKTLVRLGYIPLIDCCPLIIAKEMGFFEEEGLSVELSREASWANIRDKVCVGALDGAHMLAGIPIATRLGLGFSRKNLVTAFSLNLNGNAITISNQLADKLTELDTNCFSNPLHSAQVLKKYVDKCRQSSANPLRFAMVYPYSNHNYELRYWLAAGGINPDQDIHITVIPPQYVADNLRAGQIDGFCVGAPWNSFSVSEGYGKIIVTGYEIWNNSPEKVFSVTEEWAEKYPVTHEALIRALIKATIWADADEHKQQIAEILAKQEYIGVPAHIILRSLSGEVINTSKRTNPDYNVFHRYLANFPWCSHAVWILTQMYRWGQLEEPINFRQTAESIYKPQIFRKVATQLGINCPDFYYKTEGNHDGFWSLKSGKNQIQMGSDMFMDGKQFDPDKAIEYLGSFDILTLRTNMQKLSIANS